MHGGGHSPATKHRFAAMRIQLRLNEPELGVIDVALPHELDEKQAWMELDLYLRVWQSLHPGTRVETLGAHRPIDRGD